MLARCAEAPSPDAHGVFVPTPVRPGRQQRKAGWRRNHLSGHRLADVPNLEIDDAPDHDTSAARQLHCRAIDDGGKVAAVARQHRAGHGELLIGRWGKELNHYSGLVRREASPSSAMTASVSITKPRAVLMQARPAACSSGPSMLSTQSSTTMTA